MGEFVRDPSHWLLRLSPLEWVRAGLGEVTRAEKALEHGNARGGAAGLKRGAGMALNGALIVEPEETWGRTYVEHLEGLANDTRVPEAVRIASRLVLDSTPPSGEVVILRTPRAHVAAVEAARDVIAHAWVVVQRHEKSET
ncbi:MAG: hypothetical protein ACLP1X_27025 [Polyangiaceae bacterium]|jgi:hypothetical protein